jgi:hypothetical protein
MRLQEILLVTIATEYFMKIWTAKFGHWNSKKPSRFKALL